MKSVGLRWRVVFRSLLIQGSWNYRTLLGAGLGWALLPLLPRGPGHESSDRVARLAAPFNSHPYLAALAIGALVKVESEGADADRIRRFKDALRGPLGSLGDGFVWGVWRPLCLVGALSAGQLGAPPLAVVLGFVVVYNAVNLALRAWGAGVGLELGFGVGEGIRRLDLPAWTERTARAGVLFLGVASGIMLSAGLDLTSPRMLLAVGALACFGAGLLAGESRQRWGPLLLLLIVLAGFVWGAASLLSAGS